VCIIRDFRSGDFRPKIAEVLRGISARPVV
jgi:hypothetical protein